MKRRMYGLLVSAVLVWAPVVALGVMSANGRGGGFINSPMFLYWV